MLQLRPSPFIESLKLSFVRSTSLKNHIHHVCNLACILRVSLMSGQPQHRPGDVEVAHLHDFTRHIQLILIKLLAAFRPGEPLRFESEPIKEMILLDVLTAHQFCHVFIREAATIYQAFLVHREFHDWKQISLLKLYQSKLQEFDLFLREMRRFRAAHVREQASLTRRHSSLSSAA